MRACTHAVFLGFAQTGEHAILSAIACVQARTLLVLGIIAQSALTRRGGIGSLPGPATQLAAIPARGLQAHQAENSMRLLTGRIFLTAAILM